MSVLHQVGRLDLIGERIVNTMSGTRGLFRKEAWEKTEEIPVADITELRVSEQKDGTVSLLLKRRSEGDARHGARSAGEEVPEGFILCRPPEAIESLLEGACRLNPSISIEWTSVSDDLAAEPTIRVKTYRGSEDFQRDAPAMAAGGWRLEDQTALAGHVNVRRTAARVLTGGFLLGGASRSKDKIIVTWVKEKGLGTASETRDVRTRSSQVPPTSTDEIVEKLKRLGELRDSGIITQEDFDAKKAEMLDRL